MANISYGGKGNPPDPPKANINTVALSTSTPAARRAKNDLVLSKTDTATQLSVTLNKDADVPMPNTSFPTSMCPTKTIDNAGANATAITTTNPTSSHDKNEPVSFGTDRDFPDQPQHKINTHHSSRSPPAGTGNNPPVRASFHKTMDNTPIASMSAASAPKMIDFRSKPNNFSPKN